jgi:hypothetical protein
MKGNGQSEHENQIDLIIIEKKQEVAFILLLRTQTGFQT